MWSAICWAVIDLSYILWESDVCNQQVLSMSPLQNGISLLLILSMEIVEFLGLMIILCPVSSWIWSILNTVDSWAQAVLVGHLFLTSILTALHVVYIFLSPKWLSWIWLRIVSHFLLGMTIHVPFRMRPSSIVSSSQNVQYGCRTCGISLMVLGHPDMIMCFSNASSTSAWVACWSSCNLSLLAGSWCEIWFTCNFGNLIVSFWSPNLDRQSASKFFGPGIYLYCKIIWQSSVQSMHGPLI